MMDGQQVYENHLGPPATKKREKWTVWSIKIWHTSVHL